MESEMVKNLYSVLDGSKEEAPKESRKQRTNWIQRKPSKPMPETKQNKPVPQVKQVEMVAPKTSTVVAPPPAPGAQTRQASGTPAIPAQPQEAPSKQSQFFASFQQKVEAKKRKMDSTVNSKYGSDKVDEMLRGIVDGNPKKILVFGVGGGGSNAVNRLALTGVEDVVTIAANTDAYHLLDMNTQQKLILGIDLTEGNGAGNDPIIGEAAAEETREEIKEIVHGADMVFVTTGLGGGTGTGAAPVIAEIAKESGSLVVGVCTLPFEMEGDYRINNAFEGLKRFYNSCDTVIVIPNEKLLKLAPNIPVELAFEVVDEVLIRAVKGIINLIINPAFVNVDLADIRSILKKRGTSVIGLGEASGPNRVEDALNESLAHNLLEARISGCKGALIHITGGPDLVLEEIKNAVTNISDEIGSGAEIIWGTHIDPNMRDTVQVTTILSGVESPYDTDEREGELIYSEEQNSVMMDTIWGRNFS